jgi:cholesterol transport system auxiliary component
MSRRLARVAGWLLAATLLVSCAGVGSRPGRPAQYDFGPVPAAARQAVAPRVLVLAQMDAAGVLDGQRMLYRLNYHNPQELRAYAESRWSAPAPELVRQRLAERLAGAFTVLGPADAAARIRPAGPADLVVRLELQEFAQHFDTPASSSGRLRLRATLMLAGVNGGQPLAQQLVAIDRPAPSPDAAGGVKALAEAVDAAAAQLTQWLAKVPVS